MAPSKVPSNRTLRFVVNGTATERLAVLEGGRVAVRLELQVLGLGATASTCEYGGRLVISLPLVASPLRCRNRGLHGTVMLSAVLCSSGIVPRLTG